jgi:hypothetical protein
LLSAPQGSLQDLRLRAELQVAPIARNWRKMAAR